MITRDRLPWAEEPMMRMGHYLIRRVMPVCIGMHLLWDVLGGPHSAVSLFFDAFGAIYLWGVACEVLVHSRHLCERCAAETPLDPQRTVERRDFALRAWHRGILAAVMMITVAWTIFIVVRWPASMHQPYWSYLADIGVQLLFVAAIMMTAVHGRLRPWCPYCNWDDEGDPEPVPDPDPSLKVPS